MRYMTSIGTPHEREVKAYKLPSGAKKWARDKAFEQSEWGDRFNIAYATAVRSIADEIGGLNLAVVPIGETRKWSAKDDHTGFTFVIELWREHGKA